MKDAELLEILNNTWETIEATIDAISGTKNGIADVHSTEWQCIASLDCAEQTITKLIKEIEWNAKT